jgi:hypothetical protein
VGRPLLLHLGAVAPPQRALAARLEAAKLAGVARLGAACDMAIIPHANARNALHFVGLLVRPSACARPPLMRIPCRPAGARLCPSRHACLPQTGVVLGVRNTVHPPSDAVAPC